MEREEEEVRSQNNICLLDCHTKLRQRATPQDADGLDVLPNIHLNTQVIYCCVVQK